ncbi:MAG TPA: helix-turn-helix transcriptional regulator [Woeseiaceae bacterium]|nr:helix-turn-helix transcriptional regulator [Woeseiaceae bacterium]
MKLRNRVALNIQDLRRERGLSQEELALRAGVNRGYMGKLENAKYAASLDMLERIAVALGVDASALLSPR